MNLALSLVWLILGGILIAGRVFDLDLDQLNGIKDNNLVLGGIALLFVYNVVRWWLQTQRVTRSNQAPPVRPRVKSEEYLPEFDFTKEEPPPNRPTPPPSAN